MLTLGVIDRDLCWLCLAPGELVNSKIQLVNWSNSVSGPYTVIAQGVYVCLCVLGTGPTTEGITFLNRYKYCWCIK